MNSLLLNADIPKMNELEKLCQYFIHPTPLFHLSLSTHQPKKMLKRH